MEIMLAGSDYKIIPPSLSEKSSDQKKIDGKEVGAIGMPAERQ